MNSLDDDNSATRAEKSILIVAEFPTILIVIVDLLLLSILLLLLNVIIMVLSVILEFS
jgi:hypothetical protein